MAIKRKSLSIDTETETKLNIAAKLRTGGNVSKLIKELVSNYLSIDDNIVPILLKIPVEIKDNKKELEKWIKKQISDDLI